MTQLTTAEANYANKMNPAAKKIGLGTRIRALEGAANYVTGTEAQVPICGADGVPDAKTISGDISVNASGVTTIGANKVLKAMVKYKTISVTIAAEASTGTTTDADAVNGVILGVYPSADAGSAVKSVALTAGTGKIDVALVSAQAAETPATIQVVVLRAT